MTCSTKRGEHVIQVILRKTAAQTLTMKPRKFNLFMEGQENNKPQDHDLQKKIHESFPQTEEELSRKTVSSQPKSGV